MCIRDRKLTRSVCPDTVDDDEPLPPAVGGVEVDPPGGDSGDELADDDCSVSTLFRGVASSSLPPAPLDVKLMRAVSPDELLPVELSGPEVGTGRWEVAAAEMRLATAASRSARAARWALSAASCAIAAS